jgi:hypothetical protein
MDVYLVIHDDGCEDCCGHTVAVFATETEATAFVETAPKDPRWPDEEWYVEMAPVGAASAVKLGRMPAVWQLANRPT